MSKRVAVVGVGFSPILRRTPVSLGELSLVAAQQAVTDCGLALTDIDGLATYPSASYAGADVIEGETVVGPSFFMANRAVGPISWYSELSAGLVITAIAEARNALAAGACRYALVWRAMHVPAGVYGVRRSEVAEGESQFSLPYGCGSPVQWHAMVYRRYLARCGGRRQDMAEVVVNAHRNAQLNEHILPRHSFVTSEEYCSSRMIADPLCLYDCDIPVTACAALVMTTAERARNLRQRPAYVRSVAQQTHRWAGGLHYAPQDYLVPGAAVADRLWREANLSRHDIDVAEVYDGFSPSVLYWLEAAGFCAGGEAMEFVQDGRISISGELPVNTFGGSLGQGRLHGMGHIIEAALQVTGRAGLRQVEGASTAVVFDGSPMVRGGGLLLSAGA